MKCLLHIMTASVKALFSVGVDSNLHFETSNDRLSAVIEQYLF